MSGRRIINAAGLVLAGDLISKISLLILDGIIVSLLPSDKIAAYLLFSFFVRFAPYSGFGAISYVTKVLPQTHKAKAQQQVIKKASALVFLLSAIYFGSALILFFFSASRQIGGNIELSVAMLAIGLILIMSLQQTISRGLFAFNIYVISQLVQSIVAMGLGLLLIPSFGLVGIYFAFLASYVVAIIAWCIFSRQRLSLDFTRCFMPSNLIFPIRAGGWFFLLTVMLFFMQSLDRYATLQLGDEQAKTIFAVGFLFYQLGIIAINSIGKVAGPMILSGRGSLDETQGSDVLCLLCIVAYSFVLLIFLSFLAFAPDWIPDRFRSAHDVSIYYLTSGFVTALGLSLIPQLIRNNAEKLLLLLVLAINIAVVVGVYFFSYLFRTPQDFAFLSLLTSATFSLVAVLAPVRLGVIRLPRRSVVFRIGCVLLLVSMPAVVTIS